MTYWRDLYITASIVELDSPQQYQTELLIYLWERAAEWIDRSIDGSVDICQKARRRIEIGTHAQRYETVSTLLRGESVDARSISGALGGYAISAYDTAFVLCCEDHRGVQELKGLGRELARKAGASQSLIVRPEDVKQVETCLVTRSV